jgi:hypothetical protein
MPTLYRRAMLNEWLNIRIVLSARKTGTVSFDRPRNFRSIAPLFATALPTTLLHHIEHGDTYR